MDIKEYEKLYDIEKMRMAINVFSNCDESFLSDFNVQELMLLHLAMIKCEWDFLPDEWTDRQVRQALKGIVPQWDNNEKPIYSSTVLTIR